MKTWRKTISGIDLEFEQLPDGILVYLENHQFHLKNNIQEGSWIIVEKLPIWLADLEEDLMNTIKELFPNVYDK